MPALQVRDFPDDLYVELKECAKRNHRSMAQQTLVFIEAGLRGGEQGERGVRERRDHDIFGPRKRIFDFEEEAERRARIEKRKALFAHISEINAKYPESADMPDAETLIRERHEELEARFDRMIALAGGGGVS